MEGPRPPKSQADRPAPSRSPRAGPPVRAAVPQRHPEQADAQQQNQRLCGPPASLWSSNRRHVGARREHQEVGPAGRSTTRSCAALRHRRAHSAATSAPCAHAWPHRAAAARRADVLAHMRPPGWWPGWRRSRPGARRRTSAPPAPSRRSRSRRPRPAAGGAAAPQQAPFAERAVGDHRDAALGASGRMRCSASRSSRL
jgi:hypothetical protein